MQGLNVFGYVRSYGDPFRQTDNHMRLYQKPCARVNSGFEYLGVEKLEFKISHYEISKMKLKGMQVKNKKVPTFPLKILDSVLRYDIIEVKVGKMHFNTYIYLKEGEENATVISGMFEKIWNGL